MTDKVIELLKKDANEPDMFGIEFENGKPKCLNFIEVKSKKTSLNGKSGLKEHMKKMENYVTNQEFKFLIKNRIKAANDILKQYNKLELRNVPKNITVPSNIPIKVMAILTHKAKENNLTLEGYEIQKIKEKLDDENEIVVLSKIVRR